MRKGQCVFIVYLSIYLLLVRFLWMFGIDPANASEWRLWKEVDLFFFSVGGSFIIMMVLAVLHLLWLLVSGKVKV